MRTMITLLILLTLHFVGDFLLQSDRMAIGKSKRWGPLLAHTAIYSACFLWFGCKFTTITFLAHTATDYVTSRCTSRLWFITSHGQDPVSGWEMISYKPQKRHWFFVMIGFDQLLHAWQLGLTYLLLFGGS